MHAEFPERHFHEQRDDTEGDDENEDQLVGDPHRHQIGRGSERHRDREHHQYGQIDDLHALPGPAGEAEMRNTALPRVMIG